MGGGVGEREMIFIGFMDEGEFRRGENAHDKQIMISFGSWQNKQRKKNEIFI